MLLLLLPLLLNDGLTSTNLLTDYLLCARASLGKLPDDAAANIAKAKLVCGSQQNTLKVTRLIGAAQLSLRAQFHPPSSSSYNFS